MTGLKTNSQVMQLQEMIANKPKPCAMSRALTVQESWRDPDMKCGAFLRRDTRNDGFEKVVFFICCVTPNPPPPVDGFCGFVHGYGAGQPCWLVCRYDYFEVCQTSRMSGGVQLNSYRRDGAKKLLTFSSPYTWLSV